jgi:hypothetical protein
MIFRVVNPLYFGDSRVKLPSASTGFLLGLQFHPEDGGCMLLRITRRYSPHDRNPQTHRRETLKYMKIFWLPPPLGKYLMAPMGQNPNTHRRGAKVGPRVDLHNANKKKTSCSSRESKID